MPVSTPTAALLIGRRWLRVALLRNNLRALWCGWHLSLNWSFVVSLNVPLKLCRLLLPCLVLSDVIASLGSLLSGDVELTLLHLLLSGVLESALHLQHSLLTRLRRLALRAAVLFFHRTARS